MDWLFGKTSGRGIPDAEWSCRVDLAAAYRTCHRLGLNEGIDNHLTCAVPSPPGSKSSYFLVIPYGLMWSEVTASSLLLMDESGKVLRGEGEPDTTAFMIHSRMHMAMGEHGKCIMHTHMPYASALCCVEGGRLEMCHQNSLRYYDGIAYDSEFNGLVFDAAEGNRMAKVMGTKRVLFHSNHGVVVVGRSIAEAMEHLYYLERAAEVQVLAMSTGKPLKIVSDAVCQKFQSQLAGTETTLSGDLQGGAESSAAHLAFLYFGACKRELKRNGRDADFDT